MNWMLLTLAGLFEVAWAVGLKASDGLTRPLPALLTVLAMILSVVLLGIAMRGLPMGTAYAVWVGIGAIGTALLGMWLFSEPATMARLCSLGLILAGIVGLKLATP